MIINQLKNSMMVKVVTQLLNQWYLSKYEKQTEFQFTKMPFICQIYHLAPQQGNNEIIEILLSDSQQLLKCKILKNTLNKCADSINENVRHELQMLRVRYSFIQGAYITVKSIKFIKAQHHNRLSIDILIEELIYIDGIGNQIINDIQLQRQKAITLIFSDCSQIELKNILKKINMQETNAPQMIYDATQFPQFKHLEQQFKDSFGFKMLENTNVQPMQWNQLQAPKLKITSNIRKSKETVQIDQQKQTKQ